MLTDISRIRILVIYFETRLTDNKEKIALENLFAGRICYLIGTTWNDFIESSPVHKIIPWNFQLPDPAFLSAIMKNEKAGLEEIAYISDNLQFLSNARELIGYTVYVAPKGIQEYRAIAGICPDMICSSLCRLQECFSAERTGFKGESSFCCKSATSPGIFYRLVYEKENLLLRYVLLDDTLAQSTS